MGCMNEKGRKRGRGKKKRNWGRGKKGRDGVKCYVRGSYEMGIKGENKKWEGKEVKDGRERLMKKRRSKRKSGRLKKEKKEYCRRGLD